MALAARTLAPPAAVPTSRGPRPILLVDDDVDHAALVRRALERHGGFTVTHVADGPACLDALGRDAYALVLLDYSLPRMNGLEVLARIRELGLDVPVVMATGQGDERIAVQAMHAGALDYAVKTAGYFATLPTVLGKALKQHTLAVDNARLYAESQRQQARLAQIFDSTSDGIVLVDEAGVIVCANRRAGELFGFPPAAAGGWPLVSLIGKGRTDDPAIVQLRDLFATRGTSGAGDIEMKGTERILHWVGQPTDDGDVRGFTITFQDVTREREISRLQSDFVSFAAHQLRTPLSGIKWMLEVAAEDPDLSPTLGSCIRDAAASAERLLAMVNDLLDVSRLEGESLNTVARETDLAELTRAVLDEVAPQIAEKGHRVEVGGGERVPRILANDRLLRQAMLNLVSNAVKYTPPAGEIAIVMSEQDGWAHWMIRDNGIGIPKNAQERLFEKFYRADNAVTLDTNGKGLGLYMVRLIVVRMGGRIRWASEEGRGTTFGFALPLGEKTWTTRPDGS
jgi:PAS domain S-box-containing protein